MGDLPAFLREAASYFRNRPTGGEDKAHWANVFNAENCEKAADEIERLTARCEAYKGQVEAGAAEIERLRAALSQEREACAKVAEDLAQVYLSPQYATGQPMSSFVERHVCGQIAVAIRARGEQ